MLNVRMVHLMIRCVRALVASFNVIIQTLLLEAAAEQ